MDERLEAGMHDLLDGTANEEQSHRVRMALDSDEGARERFRVLTQLHEQLNRAERFPAPPEIRSTILKAIEDDPRRFPPPRPFWSEFWNSISRRPAVGMAWSFATGAMAVFLALALIRGSVTTREDRVIQPVPSPFAGTMVRNDAGARPKRISEGQLDLPGGVAAARVSRLNGVIQVEISVNTISESCITLKHPSPTCTLIRIIPDGLTTGRIDMAVDHIDWYPPLAGKITLEFRAGGLEGPFSMETIVAGATRRITLDTDTAAKGR